MLVPAFRALAAGLLCVLLLAAPAAPAAPVQEIPPEWKAQYGLTGPGSGALDDPDSDGRTNLQEFTDSTHPRGFFTRYLAEGATSAFFDATFALVNPADQPARVLLRFLKSDGTAAQSFLVIPPLSRRTIAAKDVAGLAQAEFSTVIESDAIVVVDRTMTWDVRGYGSHAETSLASPSTVWYLAEGATQSGFNLFYLLQNPSLSQPAQVRVRYLLPGGIAPLEKTYAVPPSSRFNIWVDEEQFPTAAGSSKLLSSTDVSAVIEVTNSVPIIVERAMYLDRPGQLFGAGHESTGITAPGTQWFLAEGATGPFFDLFILIANPGAAAADVRATFLLPDGTTFTKRYAVDGNSRFNIWVDEESFPGAGKALADVAVSTTIESLNNVPIIVERAMWWPGPTATTWAEAHNSGGATSTGTRWALADGEVGGARSAETYILIANTSSFAGTASVTLLFEDGTAPANVAVPLPANSRTNVPAASSFPAAGGKRFGAIVESIGSTPAQLVVERAMYSNAEGVVWAAGTNALATRLDGPGQPSTPPTITSFTASPPTIPPGAQSTLAWTVASATAVGITPGFSPGLAITGAAKVRPSATTVYLLTAVGPGGVTTATMTVTIDPNAPAPGKPLAADDVATTTDEVPIEIDVLANDSDPDGEPMTVTGISAPTQGLAVIITGNRVRYTPAIGKTGDASFTYTVSDGNGGVSTAKVVVTVTVPALTAIESSPADGEGSVAVTRETILRFSRPIANPGTVTAAIFSAEFGGAKLPVRIHVSPDAKTATLFYLQTLPASARVRVRLVTDGLVDDRGRGVDGDGDGKPGGTATIDFDTLTLTTLPGTAVIGRVFASQLGDGGVNTPLAGVVVSVDGLETTLRTTTDAMGNFRLAPAPVGEFFVHIDGRAATNNVPVGAYYPAVGKKWESTAGQTVTIPDVFLPLIVPGTLQPVSPMQATVINFPASVVAQDPRLAGVQITVPADALFSDNGARGGMVGIAPVAPDRIPSPLPPGLNLPLVITVQTDGGTNFDRPVSVCFPNLPDPVTKQTLAAGARSALWSFNHDIGDWEVVGSMTVSADASVICTDPGVGIRQPGWHGSWPGTDRRERILQLLRECGAPLAATLIDLAYVFIDLRNLRTPLVGAAMGFNGFGGAGGAIKGFMVAEGRRAKTRVLVQGAKDALREWVQGKLRGDEPEKIRQAMRDAWAQPAALSALERFGPFASYVGGLVSLAQDSYQLGLDYEGFLQTCPEAVFPVPEPIGRYFVPPLSTYQPDAYQELATRFGWELPSPQDFNDLRLLADKLRSTTSRLPPPYADLLEVSRDLARTTELLSRGAATPGEMTELGAGLQRLTQKLEFIEDFPRAVSNYLARSEEGWARVVEPLAVIDSSTNVYFDYAYGDLRLRGRGAGDAIRALLPPDTMVTVSVLDPTTLRLGRWTFVTGASGTRRRGLPLVMRSPTGGDTDRDGLADEAESIVGTSVGDPDTDGDGVLDGAEVQQGTNPLDGLVVQTGIVASLNTPGTAIDVAARNDIAIVADSSRGISVVNVAAGLNPIIVAQVDTPGNATAVAFEDTLVAVADGPAGLAIVDISDPPATRIVRQLDAAVLGGNAVAVTVAGGTAYVGLSTNRVATVDLATGAILETVTLPTAGRVLDVAIERDTLYVFAEGQLHAIPLVSPLQVSGSVPSFGSPGAGGRRTRLFAGGGIAYATHTSGYNTFSLADPRQPVRIAVGTTRQFGWKQIVANGSGLGLAAVGVATTDDGTHNVSLYDVSDPTQTSQFITEFETPGLAAAVSIYNGIGYVADGEAGLQVLNYLAYDRAGIPPTISLETNYGLTGSAGVAEEGHVLRLTANVDDDVQVRNVEFFVNGAGVARDGNFPFEHRFVTPLRSVAASVIVRACAVDTGGNRACTADITVTLVSDATRPRVTVVTPANGSRHLQNALTSLSATFDETINTATLSLSTFQLFSVGPDGQIGTTDDQPVTTGNVSYNEQSATAVMSFQSPLPMSSYRAVVRRSISDLSGNTLQTDFAWTFTVRGQKRWISDVSGSWHTASNWSDNAQPQPGDFIVIDRPAASPTITYNSGSLSIDTIESTEALVVSGGALSVEISGSLDGGLTVSSNGTLSGAGALTASALTWTGGTIAGTGTLTVSGTSTISSGNLAKRTLQLGVSTSWSANPAAGVGLSDGATLINPVGGIWTISGNGSFFGVALPAPTRVVNRGTLRHTSGTLDLVTRFENDGTVNLDGGTLLLRRGGASSGAFVGASGTLIKWSGDAYGLAAGSSLVTAGDVEFAAGLVNAEASFTANRVRVTGGRPTFKGATSITGLLEVTLGEVRFDTPTDTELGSISLTGGTMQGAANIATGQLDLAGGVIAGTGRLDVSGLTNLVRGTLVGRTLRLGTTTTSIAQVASVIDIGDGAAIVNPVGSVWTVTTDTSFTLSFETSRSVTNHGTLLKLGSGLLRAGAVFNNHGVVDLRGGTFLMRGGGSSNGRFSGQAGTRFWWERLDYSLGSTSQVETAGLVELGSPLSSQGRVVAHEVIVPYSPNGPSQLLGNPISIETLTLTQLAWMKLGAATQATIGSLNLSDRALLNVSSNVAIGSLNWAGGGFDFDAPAAVIVSGTTSFTSVSGLSAGLSVAGVGGSVVLGSQTTFVDGAVLVMSSGTELVNPPTGVVTVLGALQLPWNSGGSTAPTVLNNQGTVVKRGSGTAAVHVAIDFRHGGSLDLQAGAFQIGWGSGSGTFSTNAGTMLRLGNFVLNPDGSVNASGSVELDNAMLAGSFTAASVTCVGGGTTRFTGSIGSLGVAFEIGGNVDFNTASPVALPAVTFTRGRLTGSSALTMTSLLWRDGIIEGSGAITVIDSTVVDVNGSFGKLLRNRHLTLGSSTVWRASQALGHPDATIENPAHGSLVFETDALVGATLVNLGTLSFVGQARRLSLQGPAFSTSGTVMSRLGGLTAGSQYDQIVVSGTATLGGTLDVRTMDGFVPASGNSFDLMTFVSKSGTFATVVGNGEPYTVSYGPTKLTLLRP